MFSLLSHLVFICLLTLPGISSAVGTLGALNDTGITQCQDDGGIWGTCTAATSGDSAVNPRQDGRYGRDAAAAAGQLTKIGAGAAGFDFTKIANDGSELPASAVLGTGPKDWACTRDNVTGFLWEVKTNDGGVRDKYNTYTWDDTGSLVTAVNATGLCGFNDWRLPTIKELTGIVHYGIGYPGPTINLTYFPNTLASGFWSASAGAYDSDGAWYVNFGYGYAYGDDKSNAFQVRLVRAGQCIGNLTDNLDGTVTDGCTGLMWAACSVGQTYIAGTCTGTVSSMAWSKALVAAKNSTLANYSDWRLPNIKELISLVDYSSFDPSIDVNYFPNTPSEYFWSASAFAYDSDDAWDVYFYDGNAHDDDKNGAFQVRLVRAGQSFDFLAFNLNIAKLGTGSGTVTSNPTGINCGSDCSENYANGTSVTLTATAETGSTFAGWSGGGCSGTGTCTVTMNATTTVTATFDPSVYSLNVVKSGNGTVSSTPAGITCGTDCSENYAPGTNVTLKATPSTGSIFKKWSGACTVTSTSCVVIMDTNKTTTANFLARPAAPVLAVAVVGYSQVTLNWATVEGAASYKVFQGATASGESTTPVKTGVTGTSVVITGLTNGTKYFFKIAAVNAAGTSPLSNEVSATPRTRQIDFVITSLSWRPVNLNTGNFDILVTVANQGITEAAGGFLDIWANQPTTQKCGWEGDAWKEIGILAAGQHRDFTFTLKADTTGGPRTLRAFVDSWCEIAESNETNNQFIRTYTVVPMPPTISVVKGNGKVTLKWTAVTGATSYQVFQGTTASAEAPTPVKTGVTATSVVITGLTNGTTYFFTMAAVNAGGTSAWSNEVSATPAP
ncbi:conserved exported hypothetical protein [Gammaproteobacteria bacterium]